MKNLSILGQGIQVIESKYQARVQKFSFLARHHFKAKLYCYNYIVTFGKYLSELYWIVLMCF